MARTRGAGLASIFDDDDAEAAVMPEPQPSRKTNDTTPAAPRARVGAPRPVRAATPQATRQAAPSPAPAAENELISRKDSHRGKKGVLVHIPEDMHLVLRQLSVEPGGEPITKVVERGLRDYLVRRGYTKFAAGES